MSQQFKVTVEGATMSVELPIEADSLEHALELAEAEYESIGVVTRVRPVVASE